jgi:tmRNA-binding protein
MIVSSAPTVEMFQQGQRGLVKLKIGIGRARKKTDKREYIKKRDTEKEIRRAL